MTLFLVFWIFATANATTSEPFHRLGKPVVDVGEAGEWDEFGVQLPCVIQQGSLFRMWYIGYSRLDKHGMPFDTKVGYAESTDGISWRKKGVVLEPGKAGEFDSKGIYSCWVLWGIPASSYIKCGMRQPMARSAVDSLFQGLATLNQEMG